MSRRLADDRGMVSIEAAFAITAMVAVLALAFGAIGATVGYLRCVDAAREAARLVGIGDEQAALRIARQIAPSQARIELGTTGEGAFSIVRMSVAFLPGVELTARSYAVLEEQLSGVVSDAG